MPCASSPHSRSIPDLPRGTGYTCDAWGNYRELDVTDPAHPGNPLFNATPDLGPDGLSAWESYLVNVQDAWSPVSGLPSPDWNRFTYTGHEFDPATGLYYFKARFYDPELGRFASEDPYLGDPTAPPSLQRYLYANANPLVYIDLKGYEVGGITRDSAVSMSRADAVSQQNQRSSFAMLWAGYKALMVKAGKQAVMLHVTAPLHGLKFTGETGLNLFSFGEYEKGKAVLAAVASGKIQPTDWRKGEEIGNRAKLENGTLGMHPAMKRTLAAGGSMPQAVVEGTKAAAATLATAGGLPVGAVQTMMDPNASGWEKVEAFGWFLLQTGTLGLAAKGMVGEGVPPVESELPGSRGLAVEPGAGLTNVPKSGTTPEVVGEAGPRSTNPIPTNGSLIESQPLEPRLGSADTAPNRGTITDSSWMLPAPSTARLPGDIAVSPGLPRRLPTTRPIGSSPAQNAQLQTDIQQAIAEGASDIRVNQQQVTAVGVRVGRNRPDLQYTRADGTRVYIEYDTPTSGRGVPHTDRLLANDPKGVVITKTIK